MNKIAKEVFRKTLHMLAFAALIVWLYALDDWRQSVMIASCSIVVIFPCLILLSKIPGISEAVVARRKGEFAYSFFAYAMAYIVTATVLWGLFGKRELVVACFFAWAPGDAAAALIGKLCGKHKIGISRKKSLEGSGAMAFFSFAGVLGVLMYFHVYSSFMAFVISFVTAVCTAVAELLDERGLDTFLCPATAMVVLSLFELILRG
jgi:dolichol kinase